MYYKVIKNRKIVDVLDELVYVRYQVKHDVLLLCDEADAEGVLSSNRETAYHISSLNPFPTDKYPSATIEEIEKEEYDRLCVLHLMTPDEIASQVMWDLLKRGAI